MKSLGELLVEPMAKLLNKFADVIDPPSPYVFEGVKVGDRFKSTNPYIYGLEGVITVLELTERGFKYTVNKPYHIFPARWGPSLVEAGELLINDTSHPRELWNLAYEKV